MIEIPKITEDASKEVKCRRAKPELLRPLGLPQQLPKDWARQVEAKMAELLDKNRSLRVFLDSCTHCGACADKCQFFLGTGDPKNMPVVRAELLRKMYRLHFTPMGLVRTLLRGKPAFTEAILEEWYTYFYQCTECRRCATFCPFGIDTAEITRAAREIMASVGIATKYVTEVIKKVYEIGNNLGIPEAAWRDSCAFLEREMKEETGKDIKVPVNEKGAEVLLVPPSADLFANMDTTIGYAKLFHAAGISWTTSAYASEGGNFGLFLNYEHMKKVNRRIVQAARELGVRKIVMGECGHAWRAASAFMDTMNGPLDFLQPPRPQHICELAAELLRRGAFRLDKSRNEGLIVTYHDPCNVARASGILEEPREVVRAVVPEFREMHPDTIREKTFCCGAGGGLLTDEIMEVRMKGAKPRADACKATGANLMVTPCAICKAQLPEAMKYYKMEVEISGVMDLLGKALVL
jgi:Fe-S oxidoreductase